MLVLATLLALVPTPVGAGPAYHPPPAAHGSCLAAPLDRGPRMHLELFAGGRVVVVPAAIGLRGAGTRLGRVVRASCRAPVWTTDASGVVTFERGATLGTLFAVWGRTLAPGRLLGFQGRVRLYVNGVRRRGGLSSLPLRDRDEVVLEVGPYVAPHRGFRFPPR